MKLNTTRDGWVITNLVHVCKLRNGFAFKSSNYKKEGIPVIRISDIGDGQVSLVSCVKVELVNQYLEYKVSKGDILVAMSGATTGKFGIYKDEQIAFQNQRVGRFEILDERLLCNEFLLYLLYALKPKILEDAYGGAQPNISTGKIEEMEIPLPPLAEQHRIVAKIEELFSELDKGIETLKTAQQQLKVYRQAVLKYAFEGKLTNPDVKEGELPEGWVRAALGAVVVKSVAKAYPDKNSKFTFLGMDSIEPNSTKPHLFYKFSDMKSSGNLYYSGQVLYGRMRPYLNKVWVADNNGVASGEFIVLSCRESILPKYLLNILHHQDFVNFANSKTSGDRPRISFDEICEFQLVIPQISEQHAILQDIDVRMTVCEKIEESINQGLQQAETLRQSILKKAFEGKLVPQDPNDEPASVLLARIKAERATAQPEKKIRSKKVKG